MSMGILEAMAAELPAVVTDVGDNRSLVDNENPCGLTVAPENPAELARALGEMLRNDVVRRQYAAAARRRYDELYTTERMSHRHEALYNQLIAVQGSAESRRARRGEERVR